MKHLRPLLRPLMAVGAALIAVSLTVLILSDTPEQVLIGIFAGPAGSALALGDTLAYASRLGLAGLAAALAFRAGVFNLGGEGQALAGGLAGAGLAMALPGLPHIVAPAAAAVAGMAAGAGLGAVSGVLKARWNVDELISSFLIASAVNPVGHVILSGIMHDPGSYLIAAPPLPETWKTASWMPPSRFGPVIIWTAAALLICWAFLARSRRGFEWRLRGASETFARYGGIRTGAIAVSSMAVSGALFGLAGTAALLDGGRAIQGFSRGLGWDGLAVALIASSRPEWILPAALAYAWILEGTRTAMLHTGMPYALGGVVQGIVFLFVTARFFRRHRRNP